jgi:putative component of toxin-antitoxin plasmid stabilization module
LQTKREDMLIKKQTMSFKKWLLGLPYNVQIVVNDYIDRVQAGNTSNCEPVGKGVSEIKINF